jgi:hypothetical protein
MTSNTSSITTKLEKRKYNTTFLNSCPPQRDVDEDIDFDLVDEQEGTQTDIDSDLEFEKNQKCKETNEKGINEEIEQESDEEDGDDEEDGGEEERDKENSPKDLPSKYKILD